MTKFKILLFCFASAIFLNGCSQILESVTLPRETEYNAKPGNQENFRISIKNLTLKSAQKANNDPYSRKLMRSGIGTNANVFNETDFLSPNIPLSNSTDDYLLGVGDKLSYYQLNEFAILPTELPIKKTETNYLLGVGDQLTFLQMNENKRTNESLNENILNTSGIVGTDGSILLLGLGRIQAENRALNSIQTEVRNILIRNGLTPNFQLEITGFNSKRAFMSSTNTAFIQDNVIKITNIPITLKEKLLEYGLNLSTIETLIVTLTRDKKKFRITASQLLNNASNEIVLQDKDHIAISQMKPSTSFDDIIVGSDGNILLPYIGPIQAENRSLTAIRTDITQILQKKGVIPNFQIRINEFNSKKYFFINEGQDSKVISLTDNKLTLKEAVLGTGVNITSANVLPIVSLFRGASTYHMTFQEMSNGLGDDVLIQNNDTIKIETFKYKSGKVYALSGAGKALIVPIDPSRRESLADVLFQENGALNNLLAKRSEVYLLRGRNPIIAYHLDAQNVSRILVAAKAELRPNDIVYVADRPIIAFTRTLDEILPLRRLLNDIKNGDIP